MSKAAETLKSARRDKLDLSIAVYIVILSWMLLFRICCVVLCVGCVAILYWMLLIFCILYWMCCYSVLDVLLLCIGCVAIMYWVFCYSVLDVLLLCIRRRSRIC